ncbi:DmpA family aminopeptidase [Paracoccus aminophilus]|uniref:D-aminopeptidase n=1 Tax=Paracoccus aminophilus JCM 7686 TaxID=1367847 RepID=S5YRX8_PARAH|nr:P1 family peptidase [Paracoccus aminophilus]AGT07991.1 D-aminopeptidase [Paracoccus aminophilus JCM 7686]
MRHDLDPGDWWALPAGPQNSICDVAGVTLGHFTRDEGSVQTGFTAILPHQGNLFADPVPAGAVVLNGFGKSAGLIQLIELGEIETPILLTNTFAIAAGTEALIRRAIAENPAIGRSTSTVNALVLECNDGRVNDIQALALRPSDAQAAIDAASPNPPEQGTVGAGRGMKTFGLNGGIGSASRRVGDYTLAALVLSNFGQRSELRVLGQRVPLSGEETRDKGSIIITYATDAPLDSRQLTRISRRAAAGLGRLGSHLGHGSGDIALAFTTKRPVKGEDGLLTTALLDDDALDPFFLAAVETVEEAVLNAMWHATPLPGRDGKPGASLREILKG